MDDTQTNERQERQAALRRLQPELFSLEGDRGRLERKLTDAQTEVKRVATAISRLEVEKQQLETSVTKLGRDVELASEEVRRTKKKIDAL